MVSSPLDRRFLNRLFLIVGIALVLRLANLVHLTEPFSDEPAYINIAHTLLRGEGFHEGPIYAYRYPGYVWFLAGGFWTFGGREGVVAAQSVLGAATVLLFGIIVRRKLGDVAALFASTALAIYVPFVRLPARMYTENLFFFLLLVVWWLLERPGNKLTWQNAVVAGLLAGYAVLTREVFLLMMAIYVISRLVAAPKEWKPIAVFVLCAIAVVAPWTVRNYQLFGRFEPVTTNLWANIYMGNNEKADGRYPVLASHEPPYLWRLPHGQIASSPYFEIAVQDVQKREVARYWRGHTAEALMLSLKKAALSWYPPIFLDVTLHSPLDQFATGVWAAMYIVLFVLSAYGFLRGAPPLRDNILAYTLLVVPMVAMVITYVIARYRFPAELALIYFASNGYIALLTRQGPGDVLTGAGQFSTPKPT